MTPVLYEKTERAFLSNGLGRLSDALSCYVEEIINGLYELRLEYPISGIHAADIVEDRIIYAPNDVSEEPQPFRVYRVSGEMNGKKTVYARHISYDLSRVTVIPFEAPSAADALVALKNAAVTECNYTFYSHLTSTGRFVLALPGSVRAVLGGEDVSILGTYGGEIEWDRFTVRFWDRRGADNGVTIRYGKNLTALEKTTEGGAYNAIVPYYRSNEGAVVFADGYVVTRAASYTDAPPVDISDAFDFTPSEAQVEQAGLAWLDAQQPYNLPKSIRLSFAALWESPEYADYAPIQSVVLGDTVTVHYSALDVNDQLRVVRTVYDVLNKRYEELELGDLQLTLGAMLNDKIEQLQKEIKTTRMIVSQIANGTYTGGTFLSNELIYSPKIFGGELHIGPKQLGGYNFVLDPYGNIDMAGDSRIHGYFVVKDETSNIIGAMGKAYGNDGTGDTDGIALVCAQDATDIRDLDDSYDNFVIITTRGVRLQASGYSLFVSSRGAFYPHGGYTHLEDQELVTVGDISGFVTASEVQDMIDAAITPPAPEPEPEPEEE